MPRRLALAALLLCALPSSAAANPSFAVDVAAEGVPGNIPSKVTHRLTMTAGATPETLTLATAAAYAVPAAAARRLSQTGARRALLAARWLLVLTAFTTFAVAVRTLRLV